jgi:predicted amidohydrolase YtcJ
VAALSERLPASTNAPALVTRKAPKPIKPVRAIRAQRRNPRKDHRTTFHHAGYFTPEQSRRAAQVAVKFRFLDGAARTLDLEGRIGSIRVGKEATFTILGQKPFRVDPEKLRDITVIGTVYKGTYWKNTHAGSGSDGTGGSSRE